MQNISSCQLTNDGIIKKPKMVGYVEHRERERSITHYDTGEKAKITL